MLGLFQTLLLKLVEADILSHEDRIKDMNEQADSLIKSEQFDAGGT